MTDNGDEIQEAPSKILQSGEIIKPEITEEEVKALAERLYGISCLELKEMDAFDDRNYRITEDTNMKNPLITKHCPYGYVLKIMNSMDSEKLAFVEAQNETMIFLGSHKIGCPRPIRNVYGHYFSLEKLTSGKNHVVRLLEFQPGEVLASVPRGDFLYYQTGEYAANLDRLLKGFYHSGYVNHKHIWMLDNIPELENFKFALTDEKMLKIVNEVLAEFKEKVIPKIPKMEKGIIHGDFNENNIIVNKSTTGKDNDWRITAILDFGDTHMSCYLFELAITIAYAILISGDIKTGGLVLAGYSTVRIIPNAEIQLLRLCVAARLCQSLVLGMYSHQQHPANSYLITTKKSILEILPALWGETEEDITEQWQVVANDYLTRSSR